MRIARIFLLTAVTGLAALSAVGAQEPAKLGITMGYPASVGVLWRMNENVAIRPELSLSGGTSDTDSPNFDSETSGWNIGTGASVLIYLNKFDNLRTYFSPRFTYGR